MLTLPPATAASQAAFAASSCGQILHPWQPHSCTAGCLICAFDVLQRATPLYAALQGLTLLPKLPSCHSLKDLAQLLLDAGLDASRSAAFLSSYVGALLGSACLVHRLVGRSTLVTLGTVPAIMASAALLIERPSRRREFAGYLTYQSARILWRHAEARGLVRSLPYGDALVLGSALALMLSLRAKNSRAMRGQVGAVLAVLLPDDESTSEDGSGSGVLDKLLRILNHGTISKFLASLQEQQRRMSGETVDTPKSADILTVPPPPPPNKPHRPLHMRLRTMLTAALQHKHPRCRHPLGCGNNALLAAVQGAGVGVAFSLARVAVALVRRRKMPALLPPVILTSILPMSYRALRCLLRRVPGVSGHLPEAFSGFASSAVLLGWQSAGLATYVLGKAVEAWYFQLAREGLLPLLPHGELLVFALSAAVIVHHIIFRPHILPASYRKFLNDVSKGRIMQINPHNLPFGSP